MNVLLQKSCQDFDNKTLLDANGKKIKKKQATLKHRKSLTGRKAFGEDDSEDDFKPAKAAAKKKAEPKPKPAVAGPSKKESGDEKPAPAPKKAPVKKAPAKVKSESDNEVSDLPVKKKAAPKKPVKVDSDSDIQMVDSHPVQAKGKGKAKAEDAPKRKSYVYYVELRLCLTHHRKACGRG